MMGVEIQVGRTTKQKDSGILMIMCVVIAAMDYAARLSLDRGTNSYLV